MSLRIIPVSLGRYHVKIRLLAGGLAISAACIFSAAPPAAAVGQFVGRPTPSQAVSIMFKLPLHNVAELEDLTRVQSDPQSPQYHHFITVAQFRARYAPTAATVQQAVAALRASGIQVTQTHSQLLVASAPAVNIERAFGVQLGLVRDANGALTVAAQGKPTLPKTLTALNVNLIGLGSHFAPHPMLRRVAGAVPLNRTSPFGGYWFTDLKEAYKYPSYTPFNGKGVTIATVGEADFSDSDAKLYFNHELLGGSGALGPQPTLEHLNLGGLPFDPNNCCSAESNIDTQFAGGSAPGATILGIDVPPIGEGFLYGYSVIEEFNLADIVSTSYGEFEAGYTAPYNGGVDYTYILKAYHEIFLQGNSQGITFLFSSGDESGTPRPQAAYFYPPFGKVYKDLPDSGIWVDDPNATGVGGTNLTTTYIKGKLSSRYVNESAFRDTVIGPFDQYGTGNYVTGAAWGSGSGTSSLFKKPWYQNLVHTPSSTWRTDPDISMQMGGCPYYGPNVKEKCGADDSYGLAYVGGSLGGWIGTSLSSPEFAGLLAVLEQAQGNVRFGNVNGYIYRAAQTNSLYGRSIFHQGIPGYNGVVTTAAGQYGYSAILGVGTPYASIFSLLPYAPLAEDPQTSSNP
jgi:subtilase family serine protease